MKEASPNIKFVAFEWLARYMDFVTSSTLAKESINFAQVYSPDDVERANIYNSLVHSVDVIQTVFDSLRKLRQAVESKRLAVGSFDSKATILLQMCAPLLMNTVNLEACIATKGIADFCQIVID